MKHIDRVLPAEQVDDSPELARPSSASTGDQLNLHALLRDLATSVKTLSDRIGKVLVDDEKKKDEKGEKEDRSRSRGPREPPYPPPSHRPSTPRPRVRKPPSPPPSPRASRISENQPQNLQPGDSDTSGFSEVGGWSDPSLHYLAWFRKLFAKL